MKKNKNHNLKIYLLIIATLYIILPYINILIVRSIDVNDFEMEIIIIFSLLLIIFGVISAFILINVED